MTFNEWRYSNARTLRENKTKKKNKIFVLFELTNNAIIGIKNSDFYKADVYHFSYVCPCHIFIQAT
jgi:hypothetical protein